MRLLPSIRGQKLCNSLLPGVGSNFPCRSLTGEAGEQTYIDKWFSSIVKSECFYESHAESNPRRYFYNVDLQGRLFLEETLPKNIATSIKDERFLDFFFRMVRPVGPREEEIMKKFDIQPEEYPFVSPCGKELNFIRPACTPIVFHTFQSSFHNSQLLYGGTKSQSFQASDLAVSQITGRLYHRCNHMEKAVAKKAQTQGGGGGGGGGSQFALIRSAVVVSLSDRIGPAPEEATTEGSGLAYFPEAEDPQAIQWLPQEAEPGESWAMPFSEGCE